MNGPFTDEDFQKIAEMRTRWHHEEVVKLCERLAKINPANGIMYEGKDFTVELSWTGENDEAV